MITKLQGNGFAAISVDKKKMKMKMKKHVSCVPYLNLRVVIIFSINTVLPSFVYATHPSRVTNPARILNHCAYLLDI